MKNVLLFLLCGLGALGARAQSAEPVSHPETEKPVVSAKKPPVSLLIYNRTIIDDKGNVRTDQNIVPTIRLNHLLDLQLGFRIGERPQTQRFDSYDQYKVELRTHYLQNTVRFFARMSTGITKLPTPTSTKSNYMVVAEGKYPLSKKFTALGGLGYLYSFQKTDFTKGEPVASGTQTNHLLYKATLRYAFDPKGFVEAVYGLYDVFNPYQTNQPFSQIDLEYDLSERATLYGYVRYQDNDRFTQRLNVFQCIGVRIGLGKL